MRLFKLPFSILGENRSLNEHLRAKFGLKPKTGAYINSKSELKLIHSVSTEFE